MIETGCKLYVVNIYDESSPITTQLNHINLRYFDKPTSRCNKRATAEVSQLGVNIFKLSFYIFN